MRRPVSIYVLEDPLNCKVFYVGKTEETLNIRLSRHIASAMTSQLSTTPDILRITKNGSRPVIRLVEFVPLGSDWQAAEKKWIAYYRATGTIVNRTSGGQGVCGDLDGAKRAASKNTGRKWSASEREKRKASMDNIKKQRREGGIVPKERRPRAIVVTSSDNTVRAIHRQRVSWLNDAYRARTVSGMINGIPKISQKT